MDCKVLWITKRKALSKCILLLLLLLLVVQKVDNTIHHITLYPLDSTIAQLVFLILDSAIRLLNNRDQMCVRITVKAGQAYPPRPLMNYYSQFESVGSCTYQIHLCILARVPPQFPWIWCKCLLGNLIHSKIFNLTKYREVLIKDSLLITHTGMPIWIWH